ncbi:MAG: helix-turn-helix transcriptional regulator [Butyrivibrio crossotus]|nr:helix-turn-helix transcriptional regulator [Butyrivibrio crossotus]
MKTYERVKKLRKNFLKMSQTVFGERLGVSRDVIKNIELNALAKPEQKLSLLKLICKEFNVSEDWLLNGTGEMFADDKAEYSTLIDQIMTGENEFAKNIFKTFATFDTEDWEALERMIDKYNAVADEGTSLIDEINAVPDTPEELERQYPPIEINKNEVS